MSSPGSLSDEDLPNLISRVGDSNIADEDRDFDDEDQYVDSLQPAMDLFSKKTFKTAEDCIEHCRYQNLTAPSVFFLSFTQGSVLENEFWTPPPPRSPNYFIGSDLVHGILDPSLKGRACCGQDRPVFNYF